MSLPKPTDNSNKCDLQAEHAGATVFRAPGSPSAFGDWLRAQVSSGAARAEKAAKIREFDPFYPETGDPETGETTPHDRYSEVATAAVSATAAAFISINTGFDRAVRRYFLTMSVLGVRRGLLGIMAGEDTDPAELTAAQWRSVKDEAQTYATEAGFERFDVIPLSLNPNGALEPVSWLNAGRDGRWAGASNDGPKGEASKDRDARPTRLAVIHTPQHAGVAVPVARLSGGVTVGDRLVALPGAVEFTVKSITSEPGGGAYLEAQEPIEWASQQVLAGLEGRPETADQMAVNLLWSGAEPLLSGRPYVVHLNGQRRVAQVTTLKHKINVDNLDQMAASTLKAGEIGYANLSLDKPIVFDAYNDCPPCGLIEITDKLTGEPVGVALIIHALRRATNIHWQALAVDRAARASLKGQKPSCLWFTGLSGSGKSTIASLLEKRLQSMGRHTYTLDGDNVRHGLNRDLGFTDADRVENIRRIGEVSKLLVDAGLIVMCSFISPFRAERRMARDLFASGEFIEIFVDTPLDVCEARDIKGLYKKARAGELKNFTGIDSPYERPETAELSLMAGAQDPEAMVESVIDELHRRGVL